MVLRCSQYWSQIWSYTSMNINWSFRTTDALKLTTKHLKIEQRRNFNLITSLDFLIFLVKIHHRWTYMVYIHCSEIYLTSLWLCIRYVVYIICVQFVLLIFDNVWSFSTTVFISYHIAVKGVFDVTLHWYNCLINIRFIDNLTKIS